MGAAPMPRPPSRVFGTFSIVAWDENRAEWGIAVQSRFISVGALVPWGRAGVGALATQALTNASYGPDGLRLLREGLTADEVVRRLTAADPDREQRQLGVVDGKGGAAAHTGRQCPDWAGHEVGDGFTCQGNILFSSEVVRAMARTFETTPGDLPERLIAALVAGQREGGDRRGMQAASMLVLKDQGGYGGTLDRWIDIRVDDHPSPIEELQRIFQIYDLTLLEREDPATLVPMTGEAVVTLQRYLEILGYRIGGRNGQWDAATQAAFTKFAHEHNFENKIRPDAKVWPSILDYLEERCNEELARRAHSAPIRPGALDQGPGALAPPAPTSGGKPPSSPPRRKKPRTNPHASK
jgi:uncharacterized Ntn-hydrolase superfamily protein